MPRKEEEPERSGKEADTDDEVEPDVGDSPPIIADGYNQTYIVREAPGAGAGGAFETNREVLFRCGNWCYAGEVSFAGLGEGITLRDIPRAVPLLQRQQSRLKFFCCANSVPVDSVYWEPLRVLAQAQEFVAKELSSDKTARELANWAQVFPWIDSDTSSTYFELQAQLECMKGFTLVASKTYARGLVFITVYFEGSFYIVMQDGEGDQALLDIRFPDVSQHGQGLQVQSYSDPSAPWTKLTLWHSLSTATGSKASPVVSKPTAVVNLSSTDYVQTYIVMKPPKTAGKGASDAIFRDAMFRFGSWCYAGIVQLTPALTLADIPHVIPALRMQQSRLDFMCDVNQMPAKSPFTAPLEAVQRLAPAMEEEILASEETLTELLDKLSGMGLADSISSWFDGDSMSSFFEFMTVPGVESDTTFKGVDLVASKRYSPQGVLTVTVWFGGTYYVVLGEGGEEQPLLDSRFPDVSGKGRGYQIRACESGRPDWPQLRKVSVWQTAAALQKEMEDRMGKTLSPQQSGAKQGLEGLVAQRGREAARGRPSKAGGVIRVSPKAEPKEEGKEAEDAAGSKTGGGSPGRGAKITVTGGPAKAEARPETDDPEVKTAAPAGAKSPGQPRGSPDPLGSAPKGKADMAPMQAAKPLTKTKVALPHHVAPLEGGAGLEGKLKKMREEMGGDMGEAPWDAFGRPRGALGAKGLK